MAFRFSVPCDYRRPKFNQEYIILWCDRCNYGHIHNKLSTREISESYNVNYYTHTKNEEQIVKKDSFLDKLRIYTAWRFDRGNEEFLENIQSYFAQNNLVICEIGCGNGGNLLKLDSLGFQVYGIEPDCNARQLALNSIDNIYDGTAEKLPQAICDRKYDVVLMSHVLEHCVDINKAILNAKNLLNENGILIIEVPNCNSLAFKTYLGEWPWSDIPRHLNFFTPNSLAKAINKHELKVISTQYRGYCRQFLNSWLETEEKIWLEFAKTKQDSYSKPNFKFRAWKLLIKSLLLSNELKYDSVRIVATQ